MDELKKKVMNTIEKVNNNWAEAVATANKTGNRLDGSEVAANFCKYVTELDQSFIEAKQRQKGKKSKFWG